VAYSEIALCPQWKTKIQQLLTAKHQNMYQENESQKGEIKMARAEAESRCSKGTLENMKGNK